MWKQIKEVTLLLEIFNEYEKKKKKAVRQD